MQCNSVVTEMVSFALRKVQRSVCKEVFINAPIGAVFMALKNKRVSYIWRRVDPVYTSVGVPLHVPYYYVWGVFQGDCPQRMKDADFCLVVLPPIM